MNAIKRSMPMQTCTVKVYECGFLTAVEASLNKNPRIYTPSKMLHCMYPATSERNQTNRLKLVITSKNLMFEQYFHGDDIIILRHYPLYAPSSSVTTHD